jgi:hypothetical protein
MLVQVQNLLQNPPVALVPIPTLRYMAILLLLAHHSFKQRKRLRTLGPHLPVDK